MQEQKNKNFDLLIYSNLYLNYNDTKHRHSNMEH